MIRYQFDENDVDIRETRNNNDYEYLIRLLNVNKHLESLKRLRASFEHDNIHTDVLFYTHSGHEYKVIVREDHYADFLLALFKFRLINRMEWV